MVEQTYDGWDLEALSNMPNYYGWIMSWFSPHVAGRVLEYGSGTGTISRYLRPLADHLTLIEPSLSSHAALRAKFPGDPNVEIGGLMLEEHVRGLPAGSMDTAILVNVLEHIEDDRAALAELARVVAPGGHVLIFVPAMPMLMSKLDRLVGHFRRYRRAELRAKLEESGLEVVVCRYFDSPGVPPWFLLNVLLGSTSFNPVLLRIYDRFVAPVARALEGIASPPFGKNLIAIARRR
jgi:SAM-dependent methyltransferase